MATWPASGDTDWNTKMLAYLAVGHETDGTHNQEDWSPTSYTGEESVTFPNGYIQKTGTTASIGSRASLTITFGTAFPNAIKSVVASISSNITPTDTGEDWAAHTQTTTNFVMENGDNAAHTFDWIAIGW